MQVLGSICAPLKLRPVLDSLFLGIWTPALNVAGLGGEVHVQYLKLFVTIYGSSGLTTCSFIRAINDKP